MFETGVVQANECSSLHQDRKQNRDIFSMFFNTKGYCVISYKSPHRYTIFIKKKIFFIPYLQLWDFFQWTQEQVRNSCGKRAISVRAIEVLL